MKFRIFIIFSFFFITGFGSVNQFDLRFTGGVDTTIEHIVSGGLWEHEANYGRWRLIVRNLGWEHTRSFLYLQWLQTDEDKKDIIELKTTSINEFNKGDWRNVMRVEFAENSFVIFYTVRALEGIRKAILIPDIPGKYKISF